MSLSQLIYTSTCTAEMTPRMSHLMALQSVNICQRYGLTGRVLVIPEKAMNIIEGPAPIVKAYVHAIRSDSLIGMLAIHDERALTAREFEDYAVWMSYKPAVAMRGVYHLTAERFQDALPSNVSVKTRLTIADNFRLDSVAA